MRVLSPFRRAAIAALLFCQAGWLAGAQPAAANTRFVAIAFHDVTDAGEESDVDSVSIDRLVTFFDWLKADGWTVVSSADVKAAGEGRRSLPAKAIVLSFDDGYESFYTRVYPLLLAYRYPAVLSLVGEWMDQPAGAVVDYGGRPVPREHFLTWDQVRRMQKSGLVEVASHSHDLHRSIPVNGQGNVAPAARIWAYDNASGLAETDQQHRARIRSDLAHSRDRIARETGVTPHILVWPFGRFSGPALDEARALGFDQIYTLTPEAADARTPLSLPRYYPMRDPELGEIVENLQFRPAASPTIRIACVDLTPLADTPDPAARDVVLGRMIEDMRRLGPNMIVIDALRYSPDGARPVASWMPNARLPVEADIFSRAAIQLGLRGGADVYVRLRLPPLVDALGEEGAMELARQVARAAPITGLALEGNGGLASPGGISDPAQIRSARAAAKADSPLALRVMRTAMDIDPQLRLMILADARELAGPPEGADMIVWPPASSASDAEAQATRLRAAGWFSKGASGRVVLSVPQLPATDQARSIRRMQAHGANAIALCPWTPAESDILAPAFSAATYPHRP